MRTKKQRILSFLMAFILIFSFAFINPLTMQKSYGFAFAPVLTQGVARIITGVIASSGFVLHEIATNSDNYDKAITDMSNAIYQSLNNIQKLTLFNLTLVDNFLDNIVDVPISLYNSILDKFKIQQLKEYPVELKNQSITSKYARISDSSGELPNIVLPISYKSSFSPIGGTFTSQIVDLREAQPFFIYEGVDNATENIWYEDGIIHYYNDVFGDMPIQSYEGMVEGTIFLTPNISGYNMKAGSNTITTECLTHDDNNFYYNQISANDTSRVRMLTIPKSVNINDCIIYSYFIQNSDWVTFSVIDIYNKETGNFQQQIIKLLYNPSAHSSGDTLGIMRSIRFSNTNPVDYTYTYEQETVLAPTIPNSDATGNIITLPSELTGSIGLTSQEVNLPVATEPDVPNTDTMENINTNVGELVTGGTLGEQVNTNIGTVEGLHGELTEQVDFGAVFDTIAQYISSLDISAVTWFPTAVAGFLVPFLPVISLGIILFFIDRVLNGGA